MKRFATVMIVALVVTLGACSEQAADETTLKVSDMATERARVSADIKNRNGQKKTPNMVDETKVATMAARSETAGTVDTAKGPVEIDFVYQSRGRRDPFRSAFWVQPIRDTPRGPLEQYELGQLAVSAIVWETDRPRALVADPTGSAYVVREGSKVGKNDGLVIHIGDNLVLVKETYIDFAGEQSTKDVELRIRTRQGG